MATAMPDPFASTRPAEIAAFVGKHYIYAVAEPRPGSLTNLDAPDAYAWSLYHLLPNEDVIRDVMFPIATYRANGATWTEDSEIRARYFDIGERDYGGNLDDRTLSLIAETSAMGPPDDVHRLLDMAIVIRSKDAGINRLTFDIIFNSPDSYEAALRSNSFHKDSVAELLGVSVERVVGSFFVDSCNAIKISIDRPNVSASADERDVFGAQQQSAIERMMVPIYADALAMAMPV